MLNVTIMKHAYNFNINISKYVDYLTLVLGLSNN